jgi:CRISPR system Cascade subunit CasE
MSMIASVLHLDRKAITALRITDPYSVHRVVYSLYQPIPETTEEDASGVGRILYADQGGGFSGRRILLLADRMPAESVGGKHGVVKSKPINDTFLKHTVYQFKVIVNPTRRQNGERKIIPVKGRADIARWFMERAPDNWGFKVSIDHLQVDRVEVMQFKDKHQHPVTLAQAHLQGRLAVIDHFKFRDSFARGIGRGRAFGCGLLQIVPIPDNPFA